MQEKKKGQKLICNDDLYVCSPFQKQVLVRLHLIVDFHKAY